jgi:RNA polymerase sigma-70 factor (ECF subfamily)
MGGSSAVAPSESGPDPRASAGVATLPGANGVSESELVSRARNGDHAAYESLYRLNRDRIYGLLWRMSGGQHALAEDLMQEAFVRAWRKLKSFRGDSQFGTWLHRLAVNVALSNRRTRMRQVGREVALDENIERVLVGSEGVRADKQRDLERSIAKLPDRARTVLVLYDIEGYQHSEIAEMTGMAVGSSKAQLHRARKLLREELSK